MILVDTSVWIDFFNGHDTKFRHALREMIKNEEEICITEIIMTEILQGIRDDGMFENTKRYLLEFPVIKPRGIETYLSAAEIYRMCRKKGRTVRKTVDCIISAIARENDMAVYHNDNDFNAIKECFGLRTVGD
jgi:predicted nucleic acid-binding protein